MDLGSMDTSSPKKKVLGKKSSSATKSTSPKRKVFIKTKKELLDLDRTTLASKCVKYELSDKGLKGSLIKRLLDFFEEAKEDDDFIVKTSEAASQNKFKGKVVVMTKDELIGKDRSELITLCKKYQLSDKGLKGSMVKRLLDFFEEAEEAVEEAEDDEEEAEDDEEEAEDAGMDEDEAGEDEADEDEDESGSKPVPAEAIKKLSRADLLALCEDKGVDVKATKKMLESRLLAYFTLHPEKSIDSPRNKRQMNGNGRGGQKKMSNNGRQQPQDNQNDKPMANDPYDHECQQVDKQGYPVYPERWVAVRVMTTKQNGNLILKTRDGVIARNVNPQLVRPRAGMGGGNNNFGGGGRGNNRGGNNGRGNNGGGYNNRNNNSNNNRGNNDGGGYGNNRNNNRGNGGGGINRSSFMPKSNNSNNGRFNNNNKRMRNNDDDGNDSPLAGFTGKNAARNNTGSWDSSSVPDQVMGSWRKGDSGFVNNVPWRRGGGGDRFS